MAIKTIPGPGGKGVLKDANGKPWDPKLFENEPTEASFDRVQQIPDEEFRQRFARIFKRARSR